MQAVLNPASERPKAAYEMFCQFFTYTQSCTARTDNDRIVCVVNNCVVTDSALTLN